MEGSLPFDEFSRPRVVLLDSNLLLLLITGLTDRELIPRLRMTKAYAPADYDSIKNLVNLFRVLLTTPNVLTEVSNFIGRTELQTRDRLFGTYVAFVSGATENYVASSIIVRRNELHEFGLTDLSIEDCAGSGVAVITDDLPLYAWLIGRGLIAINFTHHRRLDS